MECQQRDPHRALLHSVRAVVSTAPWISFFSASLSKCLQPTTPYASAKHPIPERVFQNDGREDCATTTLLSQPSPTPTAVMTKMSRPNGNAPIEPRTNRTRATFTIATEVQVATAAPSCPNVGTATEHRSVT